MTRLSNVGWQATAESDSFLSKVAVAFCGTAQWIFTQSWALKYLGGFGVLGPEGRGEGL
jgi:hypothetical protein